MRKDLMNPYLRNDLKYDGGVFIHAAQGDRMVINNPDTFLCWTRCGKDVRANQAFTGGDPVDCPECLIEYPHASDCNVWVQEPCNCVIGRDQK